MSKVTCQPVPIDNKNSLTALAITRSTDSRFTLLPALRRNVRPPAHPTLLYAVCFGAQLDPIIAKRLSNVFAEQFERMIALPALDESPAQARMRIDAPGYIYCFHDIGDPPNVLKIGRTSRTPEQRLREWERELAPEPGKSLHLLFAYPTKHNQFAERVVHETLRCENVVNRLNPLTGDELEEFYTIENVMALSIFVRETIAFVDRWWRSSRRLLLRGPPPPL